jgi:hypothetical protein
MSRLYLADCAMVQEYSITRASTHHRNGCHICNGFHWESVGTAMLENLPFINVLNGFFTFITVAVGSEGRHAEIGIYLLVILILHLPLFYVTPFVCT